MDWKQMEERHEKQMEDFSRLKTEAWEKLQSEMSAVKEAFADENGKLPRPVADKINQNYQAHMDEWGFKGKRLTEIKEAQQKEKDTLFEQAKAKAKGEIKTIASKSKGKMPGKNNGVRKELN